MTEIQKRLFELKDEKYRDFQAKLMPTVDKEKIIGVRTPLLRDFAKEIFKSGNYEDFIKTLPHDYYEENNLHGFIIEKLSDYERTVKEIDRFLPYVDNWATCDIISPKHFKKHTDKLLFEIKKWTASKKTYTIRFGVEMLMSFYLDEKFKPEYLEIPAKIVSDEYYVNMMVAWFFATALAKQYDDTVLYIENKKLPIWTHNKTIQKAVESYRITDEQKEYLKSLKIK